MIRNIHNDVLFMIDDSNKQINGHDIAIENRYFDTTDNTSFFLRYRYNYKLPANK